MKLKALHYLRPLKRIMEKTGANFYQVAQMVELKFLLDNRKKVPGMRGNKTDPKNSIIRQAVSYIIVGGFLTLTMLEFEDPFFFIIVCQLMLMVMNTITMLAEYSVSLFDTRDNHLLIPLPVSSATLGWARVTHILIYLLLLSLSMMAPCILFVFFKFSYLSGVLFLVSILFSTLFTLFFTVFIYLSLIKVTSGEKLKDVMMYLQVTLTIGIMIGYQILPRFFNSNTEESLYLVKNWLFLAIPPAWFASLSTVTLQFDSINLAGSLMALLVPIWGIAKIGKILFRGFNESLVKLDASTGKNKKTKRTKPDGSIWMKVTSIFVGVTKKEQPIFKLMWKLSGRERLFKQSALPLLAYAALMPIILSFTSGEIGSFEKKYLPFLYFTIMSSSMLPSVLSIGNNKHADWIYKTLPNIHAHDLFKATLKAALAKFFIPVFLLVSLPLFYFEGIWAFIDLLCLLLFNLMIASLTLYFQPPYYAFTQEKAASQGGKTAFKMMLLVFVALPLGFLHNFLHNKNELLVLLPAMVYGLILYLSNTTWLKKRYTWKHVYSVNK